MKVPTASSRRHLGRRRSTSSSSSRSRSSSSPSPSRRSRPTTSRWPGPRPRSRSCWPRRPPLCSATSGRDPERRRRRPRSTGRRRCSPATSPWSWPPASSPSAPTSRTSAGWPTASTSIAAVAYVVSLVAARRRPARPVPRAARRRPHQPRQGLRVPHHRRRHQRAGQRLAIDPRLVGPGLGALVAQPRAVGGARLQPR